MPMASGWRCERTREKRLTRLSTHVWMGRLVNRRSTSYVQTAGAEIWQGRRWASAGEGV